MSNAHAILGASGMSIWASCGGYYAAAQTVPEPPDSIYSAEGSFAHAVLEHYVETGRLPALGYTEEISGHTISVDEEMLLAVETVGDPWHNFTQILGNRSWLESKVEISSLGTKYGVSLFGTADFIGWNAVSRRLTIADFKYGKGVPVSAIDNDQIRYYALAAIETFKLAPKTIELLIYQPRINNDPSWELISILDLWMWRDNRLEPAVARAVSGNAPLVTGPHCRFCRVRTSCPQIHKEATEAAQVEFDAVSGRYKAPDVHTLDNAQLSELLKKAEVMEILIRAARGEASNRIDRGQDIPDWKLVEKRAIRKWVDEEHALNWCRGLPGAVVEKPATVAQVERILKRRGEDLPEEMVKKESSGTTLVPKSDPRPAAKVGPAHDFDTISQCLETESRSRAYQRLFTEDP